MLLTPSPGRPASRALRAGVISQLVSAAAAGGRLRLPQARACTSPLQLCPSGHPCLQQDPALSPPLPHDIGKLRPVLGKAC